MKGKPSDAIAYYRPELDGLRFFAFLCVFAFHRMDYVPTDQVKNVWAYRIGTIGAFGVPVFFLLSAYLITELLLRERERAGKSMWGRSICVESCVFGRSILPSFSAWHYSITSCGCRH